MRRSRAIPSEAWDGLNPGTDPDDTPPGRGHARLRGQQDEVSRGDRRTAVPERWRLQAHSPGVGRRICRPPSSGGCCVTKRANGEGSIFAYRNGYAATVWVVTPGGKR